MTLYDLLVQLIGTPPNEYVQTLYYALCVVIVIMFLKVITSTIRSVLGINRKGTF